MIRTIAMLLFWALIAPIAAERDLDVLARERG